jgi:type IV pilus biogenesis protein PilP
MLNRQSKSIIAGAVFMLCAGSALAQPGPAAARPGAPSGNPVVQMTQESNRPQNPLEEMSRLNAEIATLKAKLSLVDLKSQIKKKEDEMLPPKPEKAAPKEDKPQLPPLPNLNSMSQGMIGGNASAPIAPKVPDVPQVVAIEGLDGELHADIQSDWGGYARVRVDDSYHEYKITEIAPNHVKARNGKGQIVQFSVLTASIQRLQAKGQGAATGPSAMPGMFPMSSMMPPIPIPATQQAAPVLTPEAPPLGGKAAPAPAERRAIARRSAMK